MNAGQDEATDLAIQGTNTSSITSKRSLERLGYLDPCHIPGVTEKDSPLMFKYVVPKPSRRSPVINRAYYQRTESIRVLIEGWIEECESKGIEQCAIISLGCGFDPTYFRLATLRKAKESKTQLKYIDIDYPTLITERLYMVRTQDTLHSLLPQDPTVDDVGEFVSDTYSCLGIDLRNLGQLRKGLEAAGVTAGLPILVISEVVLSYLEADESDAVIKFFAGYPDATFILHEQCIPSYDVEDELENLHPFASTMFRHFQRTMTPLKTLQEYRNLPDHRERFRSLGWPKCDLLNMNLFTDYVTMPTVEEHQRVTLLEPFDEHDELYWIGAYYFIAVASTGPGSLSIAGRKSPDVLEHIGLRSKLQDVKALSSHHVDQGTYTSLQDGPSDTSIASDSIADIDWAKRSPFQDLDINRKGHTLSILGDEAFVFGGFGLDAEDHQEGTKVFQTRGQQTRLNSMLRLNLIDGSAQTVPAGGDGPAPRMHHSAATTLDGSAIYVYGGRDGPNKVHNDVWRYSSTDGWDPLWRARISNEGESPVPKGLFKHTANMMMVGGREMMVVLGGRLDTGEANSQVWAFDLQECQWGHFKWRQADHGQQTFPGLFSHSSVVIPDANNQDSLLVVGGIRGNDEKVLNTIWRVSLGLSEDEPNCWVEAKELDIRTGSGEPLPPRFGHTSIALDDDRVWVMGGVSAPGLLKWRETMVEIRPREGTFQYLRASVFKELVMVGHATGLDTSRGQIIGIGGGGTCFGFGAWWDAASWALLV
ncbi:Leucine carboxyl methyltransferase 2 [Mortierella sp. NVP41]|nr:Leucine carboxyl methyltransferase 2 [Mortierella sp. NVP41]